MDCIIVPTLTIALYSSNKSMTPMKYRCFAVDWKMLQHKRQGPTRDRSVHSDVQSTAFTSDWDAHAAPY